VRAGLDLALLSEQWDQLIRLAASLRNRVASAHVVLQRLANGSPADRVAKALTTLGRIVKTIYILRYIHEEYLRRRVPAPAQSRRVAPRLGALAVLRQRGEFSLLPTTRRS
jgi:TnpA family transposase